MRFTIFTGGLILALLSIWHLTHSQSIVKETIVSADFEGSFLAISDADMIATAYATGITNKVKGIEDSLIHISLEGGKAIENSQVHVSNSVISWPAIIEWHPAKRFAYVAETRGQIEVGQDKMDQVFDDFPKGQKMTVLDYTNKYEPRIIQDTTIGENLQNVSINFKGDLLVAGTTVAGKELAIASLKEGLIDQVFYFTEHEIDNEDKQDKGFRTAEFHPTEDIIAVNLNGTSVAFYQIERKNGLTIKKIGSTVPVGKKLSVGNWHPSGNYFLVTDVNWGDGSLGFVFNGKGKLSSIKFDLEGKHQLVSQIKVGISPEGFDISPDGKYAVTVNMRRTYGPKQFWFVPGRKKSSLSLIKINEQTGVLKVIGKQYGFRGVLPEDAIFDKSSNSIAVAVFQAQDDNFPKQGWIDFWEIQNDELKKTQTKLFVTRGVHNLLLTP